jgi:hypothetical protein
MAWVISVQSPHDLFDLIQYVLCFDSFRGVAFVHVVAVLGIVGGHPEKVAPFAWIQSQFYELSDALLPILEVITVMVRALKRLV